MQLPRESAAQRIRRWFLWFAAGLVPFLLIVSISVPNLLRSRMAANSAQSYAYRQTAPESVGGRDRDALSPVGDLRKIVATGSLSLIVTDVPATVEHARLAVEAAGGYVQNSNVTRSDGEIRWAAMTLRVPAPRLEALRAQLRGLATKVENEKLDAREVTAEYVDLDAAVRNYRAEEQQYLDILRRSGTIKDTLAVAERLADVRGRIERTQGRLNLLERQVAMASLEVTFHTDAIVVAAPPRWQPLAKMKLAFESALENGEQYLDIAVAVLFQLPIILLWFFTIAGSAAMGWRLLRWMWRRWFAVLTA